MIKKIFNSIIFGYYILFIFLSVVESGQKLSFIEHQNSFRRVIDSRAEKSDVIKKKFSDKGIQYPPEKILFRCFKTEKILELWAKQPNTEKMKLIKKYVLTGMSGNPGPKRKSGDLQVPEGFYIIERFNPVSSFYLSLGINYPNASDKILGDKENPGCDIFIHGSNVTVGCIPVGDDSIKELYLVAIDVKSNSRANIPVHIFPCQMTGDNIAEFLNPLSANNIKLKKFWENLKTGYDLFEKNNLLFDYSVDNSGKYIFGN